MSPLKDVKFAAEPCWGQITEKGAIFASAFTERPTCDLRHPGNSLLTAAQAPAVPPEGA